MPQRTKKQTRVEEAKAILVVMKTYDPNLPDVSTIDKLSSEKKRFLVAALDLAEACPNLSFDDESGTFDTLVNHLNDALPAAWPANVVPFVRQFHEIVHGRKPTKKIYDAETGKMTFVPIKPLPGKIASA